MDDNKNKPIISALAIVLGAVGGFMILQFVVIALIVIVGNLFITVNPDTGEQINGAAKIIPDLLGEWESILICLIGVICLCISRKALKGSKKSVGSRARIMTMEDVKDDTYEEADSSTKDENGEQADDHLENGKQADGHLENEEQADGHLQ